MMRDTPRTFVGSVVFLLADSPPRETAERVRAALVALPSISGCDVDAVARSVLVTAREPVDRADVAAVLVAHGCSVRP
jgi:hypothetical protein